MKDSTGRNTISMLFNPEFFNINGKPLKFNLEGYDKEEFCNLAKIIEAYGGVLSAPTGDTIIFSEPNRPFGVRQCYNLKYLQDSLIANKLLELEQYKLPSAVNHQNCDVENRSDVLDNKETLKKVSTSIKVKQEPTDEVDNRTSLTSQDSDSGDEANTAARTRPFEFPSKRKINDEKHSNETKEKKKIRQPDNNLNKESAIHDEDSITQKKDQRPSLDTHSSPDKPAENKKPSHNLFTPAEKRQMIRYLVDKNAIDRAKSLKVWQEMKADLKIAHRTAEALRRHFIKNLRHSYQRYTEDVDIRERLEEVYRPRKFSFTDEENRQLINFLIDNKAISRVRKMAVWDEMAASGKFINRTARSLRTYFLVRLRRNYRQYTNDIHALEEFEKMNDDVAASHYKYYSEEEKRGIIQYLIEKKSIFRARGRNVWKEMKADKITNRSAQSLQTFFLQKLKYEYKQYTKDAEAHKEFEKLLERREEY